MGFWPLPSYFGGPSSRGVPGLGGFSTSPLDLRVMKGHTSWFDLQGLQPTAYKYMYVQECRGPGPEPISALVMLVTPARPDRWFKI